MSSALTITDFATDGSTEALAKIDWCLKSGVSVNYRDSDGNTAVHIACIHGHISVIKLLKDRGGSLLLVNNKGYTGMHLAAAHGHTEIVKYLHAIKFFDIYAKDKDGWTALDWARMNGRQGCILYLEYNSLENIAIRNHEKAEALKREERSRAEKKAGQLAKKSKIAACAEQIQSVKDFLTTTCSMSAISSDIYAQSLVVDHDVLSTAALNDMSREDLQAVLIKAGLPVKKAQLIMEKFGWTISSNS